MLVSCCTFVIPVHQKTLHQHKQLGIIASNRVQHSKSFLTRYLFLELTSQLRL